MARSSNSGDASARATAAAAPRARASGNECDFDTQQMEQAEFFLATIMDERAAQDAFDLDERSTVASQAGGDGCEASGEIEAEHAQQPVSTEPVAMISSTEAMSISCASSPVPSSPDLSATAAAHRMPPPLELSIVESTEGLPVQWSLISPWSEGDEDAERSSPEFAASPVFFQQDDRTEDDESSSVVEPESEARMEARLRELVETEMAMALEAKLSRTANGGSDEDEDAIIRDIDVDEDDEEFDVYNNTGNMFVKAIGSVEEFFEEKLDSTATEEDENEEYTDGTRTSVATTLDDSCEESPRASVSGNKASWGRRIRSQTYNGSAAVSSVKNACKMIRSRTLSTTSSFRRSSESRSSESLVDDGDFSSDDEGCSRASRKDGSFSSTRSTLSSRFSLKVPNKMSINWRTRTSSATTTASEDSSYPTSPLNSVRGEAQSGFSFSTIDDPFTSGTGSPQNQQSNARVMQAFKNKASVCASQAAGYLNSKSAEAARKIKAKTFRGAAVAKPTASETEEEAEPPSLSDATA